MDIDQPNVQLAAGSAWVDLVALYPAMSGVACQITNIGSTPVQVAATSSASAPTSATGITLQKGDQRLVTSSHIWVVNVGNSQVSGLIACGQTN